MEFGDRLQYNPSWLTYTYTFAYCLGICFLDAFKMNMYDFE